MPHPDFEALNGSVYEDLVAALAQGKHVQFAGRTATTIEELEFAVAAASKEDESAKAVSDRAAILGGPRVPVTKADLQAALQNAELEFNHDGLIEAIKGAISAEAQPLRDLAEAILSTIDRDARIVELSSRVAVLEAENAQLRAAGTATLQTTISVAPDANPEAVAAVAAEADPTPTRRR